MRFLAALEFLTIIRLRGRQHVVDAVELGRSTVYFPLVGGIIGLILAGVSLLLGLVLPLALVNALLIAFLIIISGGMHIDGFIDTCDGIGGQKPVEERWRIMHEGRAGAFGIAGAISVLLVKYVALNSIPPALVPVSLILLAVVSRWSMVYALFAYPYARPTGMGKIFKEQTHWQGFTIATIITLASVIILARLAEFRYFYIAGFVIIVGVWLVVALLAVYLRRKFAGLTGDTYGAINEVAEVIVLILVLLVYERF
ncbi:MAG: adenosylcobinamide-GDP ribazoletransferase [Chloroflexi bacterium]|nr:adenosylcobinamide-GDP ribazoletransferase [Chloroflexota bacterium]